MLKNLFPILFLAFAASQSPAQTYKDMFLRNAIVEMRDMIYTGNIDRVSSHIERQQERFMAGEVSADHMRAQFTPFGWANPDTAKFAQDWLIDQPASPYAQLALAWSLNSFSWNVRGGDYAKKVHPRALSAFRDMQFRAWSLARVAYKVNPDLIPASDAILRLANANFQRDYALEVLNDTFERHPNEGSLERGLGLMLPGWGATYEMMISLCDTYAHRVPNPVDQPGLTCRIQGALQFPDEADWIELALKKNDLPHLDRLRLHLAIRPDSTREEAQFAYDLLSEPNYVNILMANRFDTLLAQKYGFETLRAQHWNTARKRAVDRLADDPFNPHYLLQLMEPTLATEINAQGQQVTTLVKKPDLSDMLDYAERLLIAMPFTAEHWTRYIEIQMRMEPTTPYADLEPYRINALVFSNHSADQLSLFLREKAALYDLVVRIKNGEFTERQARPFKSLDLEADIMCPFVRADRLLRYQCSQRTSPNCTLTNQASLAYALILKKAEQQGICSKERKLPAFALGFSPVNIIEPVHRQMRMTTDRSDD